MDKKLENLSRRSKIYSKLLGSDYSTKRESTYVLVAGLEAIYGLP
jgi:hypothetical protein